MKYNFPHSIENCIGEKITFLGTEPGPDGDKLLVENHVTPGHGPVMHTHWLQDECLTVVNGKIGYQVLGQGEKFAGEGESILFKRVRFDKCFNPSLVIRLHFDKSRICKRVIFDK